MENRGRRSYYAKTAQQEMRGSSVPSWEKKFCYMVGGMRWKKFLQNKPYTMLREKVMEYWDDSAVEEAFNNAKSRFWAKINHQPCDLLSPDPDANIDVIDWDSPVDEDRYQEVELEWQRKFLVVEEPAPPAPLEEVKSHFLLTREGLLLEMKAEPTGWGDEADAKQPQSYDWENKAFWVDNLANECGTSYQV